MARLENRIAVVTGAAQGMGMGIAAALAREGARVFLWDVSAKVADTADAIDSGGQKARACQVDVGDAAMVKQAAAQILDSSGRIDILVNNAGIARFAPFIETQAETLDLIMRVNFNGVWNCTQAVLPGMLRNKFGRIINVSSVTGPRVGDPGLSAYSASKGAVCALARTLALEVAPMGITVNTILPGYIDTPLMKPLADSLEISTAELSGRLARGIPLKRIGTIHDIGNLALFLASAESEYITGQEFVIDGGNIIQEKSSL